MSAWLAANESLLWWLGIGSAVTFLATLVAIPVLVIHIPTDYFRRGDEACPQAAQRHPVLRWLVWTVRNSCGALLVLAGIAMLVLPGQGVLTILVGLMMIDFPAKSAFERWLVTRPPVYRAIDKLRTRAGRAPLDMGLNDTEA